MRVTSTLPQAEIDEILRCIQRETDDEIVSLEDEERGVLVKSGRLHGYHWRMRRGRTEWKILQKLQWCS